VIGRNDPCPCGSGLKYKKCCRLKAFGSSTRVIGQVRFEPGSYGGRGSYMPSLAGLSDTPEGKEYRFVLVNRSVTFDSEDDALVRATSDFANVCEAENSASSFEVLCRRLAGLGYKLIEDFKVVPESHD
jgi:SEC-C motif